MIPLWLRILTVLAAVGSGLVAGTFFAFSTFVMRALARLPAPQGIVAMQSINRTVLNPFFLGVFVGTAGLCLVIVAASWFLPSTSEWMLMPVAGLFYLLGTFLVTVVRNVPLNEVLETVDADHGAEEWSRYLWEWTRWNHLRAIAATIALALFLIGFLRLTAGR